MDVLSSSEAHYKTLLRNAFLGAAGVTLRLEGEHLGTHS
jgi:hypothetical protein